MKHDIQWSRRGAIVFAAAATIAGCAPFQPGGHPLTLEKVVHRNTIARGGATALDRVQSVAVDVEIDENGQKLNGHYAATADGLVRIDIYADGKSVFSEGVDFNGAWLWPGGKEPAKPSVEGGRSALLNGAANHLLGWHRFAAAGHVLTLMPPAAIDGIAYPVVQVRYSTGQVSYFYVDPASWLVARRRDERAYHPDVDPTKQKVETRFSEFVAVDGTVASHVDQDFDLATGKLLATHRVLSRRINPDLPADYFDRNRRAPAAW